MSIQKTVQNLIASGNIEKAIDSFLQWANTQKQDDLSNSLILQKGRFSQLKRNENMGVVDSGEANRTRAQIANAILHMVGEVEDSGNLDSDDTIGIGASASTNTAKKSEISSNNTILFLAANPTDTTELDLEKEFSKVHNKLQDTNYQVKANWALSPGALQDSLLKYKPRFVHFSGHGEGKATAGARGALGGEKKSATPSQSGIYLQNASGGSQLVSGAALASLFKICMRKFKIDVVILNACYSEMQAKAIFEAGVPYVIGMNRAVNDDTAIEFANGFYRGLASEDDVVFAFDLAKNALLLEGLDGDDIPVLYKKD